LLCVELNQNYGYLLLKITLVDINTTITKFSL